MSTVTSFDDLGAPRQIVSALAERGITEPFPIQAAVLADALDGRDILGRAPTGSGKTLAFGIPVVARMDKGSRRRPTALVLSPTRELADQIADELRPLASAMGHSVAAVYGGVGYNPQRRALDRGASLVVACPGRLEDLLESDALTLDDVDHVVVDEADRMSDMGFLPAVRRIVGATHPDRHLQLFSATLEGPVAKLTRDFQRDPARHEVGSAEPDMTLAHHMFWSVQRTERVPHVAQFIDAAGSTIVFTRTRHGADRLARQLGKNGIDAAPIHGGRSQAQRTRALKAFADDKVQALVATDVAARGIHVDDVGAVVHFDPPEDGATYVHRSGRTARAGASGMVLSMVEPSAAKSTRKMQKSLGLPVGVTDPDIAEVREIHSQQPGGPARPAAEHQRPEARRQERKKPQQARAQREDRHEHRGDSHDQPARKHSEHKRTDDRHDGSRRMGATPSDDRARPGKSRGKGKGQAHPDPGDGELTGRVSHYSRRKGFGFIKVKGRKDLFVHISGVQGEPAQVLTKGNQVAFEVEKGRKGPIAVNVRSLSKSH